MELSDVNIVAFTMKNPKYVHLEHPEEDSYRYRSENGKIVVAVADGITRDPLGIRQFPDNPNKKEMRKMIDSYPRPSPAKKAADTFCECFIEKDESNISRIFERCNEQIKALNDGIKIDYLEKDFAACVASGGIIENKLLKYGFIADCGVCVYDSEFKQIFRTPDEGPNKEMDEEVRKTIGKGWNDPEVRKEVRSKYRNNPKNKLSYGAMTGESDALQFVKKGEIKLESGNIIIFYSDGMSPLIYSDEMSKIKDKSLEGLKDYISINLERMQGSEGTIVALKIG